MNTIEEKPRIYHSNNKKEQQNQVTIPIEFQNPPIVFKSLDNVNYTAIITSAISNASATTTNPGSLQLFRTASTNAQDYKINILAIGQIKSN